MSAIEAELEIGEVVSYSPVTHHGFMVKLNEHGARTGEQIFFHYDDGEFVNINEAGDGLEFVGSTIPGGNSTLTIQLECGFPEYHRHLRGKKLAFRRMPGRAEGDKDRAEPWTSTRLYKGLKEKLEAQGVSQERELIAN